jgi:superfamily I DNA and/or RNA helicase
MLIPYSLYSNLILIWKMNAMGVQNRDDMAVEQGSEKDSFVKRLAQYYSDFLATDFKKGSLPKRRYQTRDKKGRRTGIPLEKFPSFLPKINKLLDSEFGAGPSLIVKYDDYKADLPKVVSSSINSCIERLEFDELHKKNLAALESFKNALKLKELDVELESNTFLTQLKYNVGIEIGSEIIRFLQPTFERSASNLIDSLVFIDENIAELLVNPVEEALPSAVADLISSGNAELLEQLVQESFCSDNSRIRLTEYFDGFSAGNLFTELRELSAVEQLEDNLEFYLYLGEIKYKTHQFPLFYLPFKLHMEGAKFTLSFDSRVLINKKGIDYIARVIQEQTKITGASVIDDRILYLEADSSVREATDNIIQLVLRSFQMDGSFSLGGPTITLRNSSVSISSSLSMALFDKSDESMLSDYEELLVELNNNDGSLLSYLNDLVMGFMHENPISIVEDTLNEWDELEVTERLVFDSPIPLAEEQRKIINALENKTGKFITVEGPPGTGKSHTISAIAFGAILKKRSVLILSDKKEALDVVENKLQDTLAKVRPTDDFVNPILRLGKAGANFNKLTTTKSIDKLRIQNREINKERDKRAKRYESFVQALKDNINKKKIKLTDINCNDIFALEAEIADFKQEWSEHPDFIKLFEGSAEDFVREYDAIELFCRLRSTLCELPAEFQELVGLVGEDTNSIVECYQFVAEVQRCEKLLKVFSDAPKITSDKLTVIDAKIKDIKQAKGIFGYFFSRKQLATIKSEVYESLGYQISTSNGHEMIQQLSDLRDRSNEFYKLISQDHQDNLDLIPSVVSRLSLPRFYEKFVDDLIDMSNLFSEDELPFWEGGESEVEALISLNSGEADFYLTFKRLREEVISKGEDFNFEQFDYSSQKADIEAYNTLELATEIDSRVINFADNYKNDVRTLSKIIRQRKKFPREKFDILKEAFPCMICSLRDYAEYIPLEKELFDIIIIDEASQVSIAQAFPAILRAKKMIVLGDRRQFGNVKTSNASKELNNAYFTKVKEALALQNQGLNTELEVKVNTLNISSSVLDFMESISNFGIMLKKHFRGYPEMISFSSKYFYGDDLQAMKVRGKAINDVLEFVLVEDNENYDLYKNTNEQEADCILERILNQLDCEDFRSVAVITPFTEQQTYISRVLSKHARYQEMRDKLRLRCFTFDSCQGEERDIIYYSMVASSQKDKLWTVLPKSIEEQGEEELDRNKRMQRLNVAFSRGKEKLVFVHSKPIAEFSAGREALLHFERELSSAQDIPPESAVDKNSEAEKKVLQWIQQTSSYLQYRPEIIPQFEIGRYLKALDKNYHHPAYRVDFLMRFFIDGHQIDIIVEYDGFEYHFDNREEIDSGNWRFYQKDSDVERDLILESYGYRTLRINKFNSGGDPVSWLSDRIDNMLKRSRDSGNSLIKKVIEDTSIAQEGLSSGTYRHCKKCDQNKPTSDFATSELVSGYRRYCRSCSGPIKKKKRGISSSKKSDSSLKLCRKCNKKFPLEEFVDFSNKSGKRSLCGSCKAKSEHERRERYKRFLKGSR